MMTRSDDPVGRATHEDLDRLAVTGIEGFGHHGVLDFERRDGQVFLADLVLGLDTRDAARSDDLQDTVDYGSLVAKVRTAIESDPVDLIEALAQRIADICVEDPRVRWVEVTVHKPGAPIDATFTDVSLTITRTRPSTRPSTGADRD
jgi:7,8-dihydroneopterin aldolase/epimerase/oxygenase